MSPRLYIAMPPGSRRGPRPRAQLASTPRRDLGHRAPRWQRILSIDEYANARAVAGPRGAAIVAVTIRGEVKFDGVTVGAPDQDTLVLAQFGR